MLTVSVEHRRGSDPSGKLDLARGNSLARIERELLPILPVGTVEMLRQGRAWARRLRTSPDHERSHRRPLAQFVETNLSVIKGRVLELRSTEWTDFARSSFRARALPDPVQHAACVDDDPLNVSATIFSDICSRDPLGGHRFDCELLIDTVHRLPTPDQALRSLWAALDPGGNVLVSAPLGPSITSDDLLELLRSTLAGAAIDTQHVRAAALFCAVATKV